MRKITMPNRTTLTRGIEKVRSTEPMVKSIILVGFLGLLLIAILGTCRTKPAPDQSDWEDTRAGMLVAQAETTAHFISAAVDAGMMEGEINRTLRQITQETITTEIWVTDSDGRLEYSSHPDHKRPDPTQGDGGPVRSAPDGRANGDRAEATAQGERLGDVPVRRSRGGGPAENRTGWHIGPGSRRRR